MIALLGVLAGACFAYAAVPEAFATLRASRHRGAPLSICVAVLSGTILMYSYLLLTNGFDALLAVVYSVEALSWGVLTCFGVWGRK